MAIYFIQAIDGTGPIKIGYALDPKTRLAQIQTMSPVFLRILAQIKGNRKNEIELHRRLAEFRSHGEWFDPVPEVYECMDNDYSKEESVLSETKKQGRVRIILSHGGFIKSDREIARICDCTHVTVRGVRRRLEESGQIPLVKSREVKRNGGTIKMDTSRIGSLMGGTSWENS